MRAREKGQFTDAGMAEGDLMQMVAESDPYVTRY